MTTRRTLELDTFILLAAAAAFGIVFSMYFNKPNIRVFSLLQGLQESVPTTSPLPPNPKVSTISQTSPDGVKKLTMTITPHMDITKTYMFFSGDKELYNISFPEGDRMSVPFNAWSPDNKYVFLESITATRNAAIVMRADGRPITGNDPYFDVAALFATRNTGYAYQETTGWASETLLIVNTTRPDGSKGPSYWVEIPSKAVIQLATDF